MNKLTNQSVNIAQSNIEQLRELFPSCVTESKNADGKTILAVDFDRLRQELSATIIESPKEERYELNWPGKRAALALANASTTHTLRPDREQSIDFDSTRNLFIEGDNLEALKLLQKSCLEKVKMIYIDPPYNTGKDFIYKDNFSESSETYLKRSGQVDEEGNRLVTNKETNGRFHSDWLSMIYPRLKLARNLLTRDGVIFISIDDYEAHNLRKVCDEVFGATNFIAQLVWQRAYSPKNDGKLVSKSHDYILMYAKHVSRSHDYVLMYAKEKSCFQVGRLPRTKKADSKYTNPDNDPRGVWKSGDLSVKTYNAKNDYPITTPSGKVVNPPPGRCWSISKEAFKERLKDNRIWFGRNGDATPGIKRFLNELKLDGMTPTSILFCDSVGDSQEALKEIVSVCEDESQFFEKHLKDSHIWFGPDDDSDECIQRFFSDFSRAGLGPSSILLRKSVGDSQQGTQEVAALFERKAGFDGPKPVRLLQHLMKLANLGPNDLVLDFFAGSGSTAHAVMQTNAQEGTNRAFIVVQLPEKTSKDIDDSKKEKDVKTISALSQERIRRAGVKILDGDCEEGWNKDIGFRMLRIDQSSFEEVLQDAASLDRQSMLLNIQHIKSDRSAEDLLFQVLVDWGIELTLPIYTEDILGKTVYFVQDNALMACFDKDIDEALITELAKYSPLRVVFRDDGFTSDSTKINAEQIFKQVSPHTDVRSI